MSKKKKIWVFPETPTTAEYIGKWHIAISSNEDIFYFWDGKSPAYNFHYRKDSPFIKELVKGIYDSTCPRCGSDSIMHVQNH